MSNSFPFFDVRPEDELPHEVTTASRQVLDGKALTFRADDVALPSGRTSVRGVVDHPGSVVVIPVTDDDHVLLIRQYRHAIGEYIMELPAGLIDPGEEPLETARRELVEETSHAPATVRLVASAYVSPGYTTERTAFVLAEGCKPVAFEADPDEPIQLARVPIAAIPELLVPGDTKLVQAQAMLGLMWLLRLRG